MVHRCLARGLLQTPAIASKEEQRRATPSRPRRSSRFAKRNMGPQPRTGCPGPPSWKSDLHYSTGWPVCGLFKSDLGHQYGPAAAGRMPWATLLEVGLAIFHRLASVWTIAAPGLTAGGDGVYLRRAGLDCRAIAYAGLGWGACRPWMGRAAASRLERRVNASRGRRAGS